MHRPSVRLLLVRSALTGHVLSLDAVAVALVWQAALGRLAGIAPTLAERVELAAVVAAIYLLDRQLDAAKLWNLCHATARHAAHQKYAHLIRPLIPVALLIAIGLLPWLVRSLLIAGSLLGLLTLFHLALVQLAPQLLRGGVKELSVGLLFSAGCGIHALAHQPADPRLWIGMTVTGLLFAFNCICLGTWEADCDAAQGLPDLRTTAGLSADGLPAAAVGLMLGGLTWAMLANRPTAAAVALAALLLIGLNRLAADRPSIGLRIAADLVLLTPLLIVAR